MKLLHRVIKKRERGRGTPFASALFRRAVIVTREVGETHLKARASDDRPAITMQTRSSIGNFFCWYEAGSPHERYERHEGGGA